MGEDFFGLKAMGLDEEFGLSSLSVPSSLFYGRGRHNARAGQKG
jgi:transcriptional activator SPT7